ncbi:hypothetical protein DMH18_26815 [Streptomyces sp. WAC 06783]|nr:hypothetical protein DMH18_26815 [Streptomyces sp. WAC 06783]
MGAVAVTDTPGAEARPYVFVRGLDSHLHLNWWNGKSWLWSDQGTPSGHSLIESVGAVSVQESKGGAERPYAFVIADDSQLYSNFFDGSTFLWHGHDAPGGHLVREGVGALAVQDAGADKQRPYAYVIADDFRLWVNFSTGTKWEWADLGTPPGHTISRPIGVTTVRDSSTQGTRPYAFVITEDSKVWVNMWDGSAFGWGELGAPPGQLVRKGAGVVTVKDDQTSPERPYAFVIGYDSQLYSIAWINAKWAWTPHQAPSGRSVLDAVGAVTIADDATSSTRPYVFVTGDDSQMYVHAWISKKWSWEAHQGPGGPVIERPGAVTYARSGAGAGQRPYAFVITSNSSLWSNFWQ